MEQHTQTLVFAGGYALLHQAEYFMTAGLPARTKVIYYVTPHFSQSSNAYFDDFKWGQTYNDWPPYSRPRLQVMLGGQWDMQNYIPLRAVREWCISSINALKIFASRNPSVFELHIVKRVEIVDNKTSPTKSVSIVFTNLNDEIVTHVHQLTANCSLISGIKLPRRPRDVKYRDFETDSNRFFLRDPRTYSFDVPYLLIGHGASTLWISEIVRNKVRKDFRILDLTVSRLPKNNRNQGILAVLEENPADYRLTENNLTFRLGNLLRSTAKYEQFFKNQAAKAFETIRFQTGYSHANFLADDKEDLLVVFASARPPQFFRVITCSGFGNIETFPESTPYYYSYLSTPETQREDVVATDARGSVAHELLNLDYFFKVIKPIGSYNFDTYRFNKHVHRALKHLVVVSEPKEEKKRSHVANQGQSTTFLSAKSYDLSVLNQYL